MREQLPHHDVAALVEPQVGERRLPERVNGKAREPRPGRVDEDARGRDIAAAAHFECETPLGAALGAQAARARADCRTAVGGVACGEHDEAGVVGRAIGIFEAVLVAALERRAERIAGEVDAARARQRAAAAQRTAQVIVDEKPGADERARAHAGLDRKNEAPQAHQMRRHPQHHFALGERLAHQAQPAVFEIAQPAVDQLGRG